MISRTGQGLTRHAGIDVSPDGWDSDMQCYPSTFECDGNIYLLYNGNELRRRGFGAAGARTLNAPSGSSTASTF